MPSSYESAAAAPQTQTAQAQSSPLPNRLEALNGLLDRPLEEHAEVYQRLHADLQAALAEIDGA